MALPECERGALEARRKRVGTIVQARVERGSPAVDLSPKMAQMDHARYPDPDRRTEMGARGGGMDGLTDGPTDGLKDMNQMTLKRILAKRIWRVSKEPRSLSMH